MRDCLAVLRHISFLLLIIFGADFANCQTIVPWDLPDFYLDNLKAAFNSVTEGNMRELTYYYNKLGKLESDFIDWYKLFKSCPDNQKIEDFMIKHKGWPKPVNNLNSKDVITVHYFNKIDYRCNGKDKRAVFLNYDVLGDELRLEFADKLLKKKDIKGLQDLIGYFSNEDRRIITARIDLINNRVIFPNDLLASASDYKKYFSLIYEYVSWYVKNKKVDDKIIEIISLIPIEKRYADNLWNLYKLCIRDVLYGKKSQYYLSIQKLLKNWSDKSNTYLYDSYWLSGWIAFEFLNDKNYARDNFERMYRIVSTPTNLSKAAYWIARVYESQGNSVLSSRWYKISSGNRTTFYGQLSLLKTGVKKVSTDHKLSCGSHDYLNCKNNIFAKIYYLAMKMNDYEVANVFSEYAIKNVKTREEIGIISELSLENNFYGLAIKFAKLLEHDGVFLERNLFPLEDSYFEEDSYSDRNIALSIIRQESRFDQYAKSRVGATGLMQLMPNTAKEVAKDLGISYEENELFNPKYNVKLGIRYFKNMLKYYNNSLILSAAAYNAGPSNVNKWIRDLGDPRKFKSIEEMVSWIESIPFMETRDYVKIIIENFNNYKGLLQIVDSNFFFYLN